MPWLAVPRAVQVAIRGRTVGRLGAIVTDHGAGELQVPGSGCAMPGDRVAGVGTREGLGRKRCSPDESDCGQDRCEE